MIDKVLDPVPKIEFPQAVVEMDKQLKLVGKLRIHNGHTLFKINKNTLEVSKAEFRPLPYSWNLDRKGLKQKKEVIIDHDYLYVAALNETNLIKKMNKLISNNEI